MHYSLHIWHNCCLDRTPVHCRIWKSSNWEFSTARVTVPHQAVIWLIKSLQNLIDWLIHYSNFFGSKGLVGWLVVFNVPSTARSFRDGTPIYCPLRRTWSHVALDRNPGPGYNTLLLRMISDLLSTCPHRQFHTLTGLLDSRAALSNSFPNACVPMQGGSLYHFYDGLGMTRPEREPATYRVRGGHANH